MADLEKPKFEDAPGVEVREYESGWEARWRPRPDLVERGYPHTRYRLWFGPAPTDRDRAYVSDTAKRLQNEMLVWGRGGIPVVAAFDGTLRSLMKCYQEDPDSTFKKIRYQSRQFYTTLLGRIGEDHGSERLADINARLVKRWHEEWSQRGIAAAHAYVGMLRTVIGFGFTLLEDKECERLVAVLHKMKFPVAKPRTERLTAEQAKAIRMKAHELGRHSIALAQAFQFECMLRQKDVIGEWVPRTEPGVEYLVEGNSKWLRGLCWEEIGKDLVLRHTTSKRQKDIESPLRLAPMVMEELDFIGKLPDRGPIVISETTGLPYAVHAFRIVWREVATAAGIPTSVKNMDSRAGAISEATDAGAELEHVRHAATHSDISMTQRYSRGAAEKVANVMTLRVAHRNKSGN